MLLPKLPQIFQMEIYGNCNYNCIFCPYGNGYKKRNCMIYLSYIKQLHKKGIFKSTKEIGLHVLGESTLHPEYFEIIKFLNSKGIKVKDATNASRFEDIKFVKNLLKSKLSMLVISLDAFYETTYSKVKKTKIKLSDILPGLIYYLKHTKIKTYIQAIRHEKYEKNEIKKFIKFWGKYFKNNLISFDYKFLDTWSGHFSYATTRETLKEKKAICPNIFRSISILSNGKVVPCCRVFDWSYSYGNIFKEELKDIWGGKKHLKLIKDMLEGKYKILPCKNCKEWNIIMDMEVFEE